MTTVPVTRPALTRVPLHATGRPSPPPFRVAAAAPREPWSRTRVEAHDARTWVLTRYPDLAYRSS